MKTTEVELLRRQGLQDLSGCPSTREESNWWLGDDPK
jgi:hypothetical protein